MEDKAIVELYWARKEQAIAETDKKYGKYCYSIAYNILTNNEELALKINKAIFPGIQGGPLMHVIAAKAVCFGEALKPEFKAYQQQIIKNAQALCNGLTNRGIKIVSGGTDNHLMLLDLRETGVTGKELEKMLDEVHITANKNTIPFDQQKPSVASGVRIGTPAATTRGIKEDQMDTIGKLIVRLIDEGEAAVPECKKEVLELCEQFPLYPGL